MKYKKEILILSVILIFFIYIGGTLIEKRFPVVNSLPPVIRFHVRANSDTKEDQELKLEVRDEVLDAMGEMFEDITSIEESRKIILENTQKIEDISKTVIKKWGKDYPVGVSLKKESFPIRKYGNLVFPQGDYEALIVEIGKARGANWWCVMFPPICLVDVTHSVAIEDTIEENPLDEFIIDENRSFKLKSIIFDFFKPFFSQNKTREI